MSVTESFRQAMCQAGLEYPGPILADGKLHKFNAAGHHGHCCWFVLHADRPANGIFACYRLGIEEHWHDHTANLSQIEWDLVRRHWAEDKATAEREQTERHAKARAEAKGRWDKAGPPDGNAYLTRKGVQAHGELRQEGDCLLVPLQDAGGVIQSLQLIAPDKRFGEPGDKRDKTYLPGGRTVDCYFVVGDNPDGPLVLCEGYATGASLYEATGHAVICAMTCHNLPAVAQAMRAKWPEREIILAADDDRWPDASGKPKSNAGVEAATAAAKAVGAKLAVPRFADTGTRPTDFNDLARLEGPDAVRLQILEAAPVNENDAEAFERLAKLAPVQYDRARDGEAKRLGIRVATLDTEVAARRPASPSAVNPQGTVLHFEEIQPWAEPVNGNEMLNEILGVLQRFVVAANAGLVGAALWTVHSHAFDFGDVSPLLIITSPTKRCGKSRLLRVLSRLVRRPLIASSASAAGIYRAIELHHPTLLVDEVDTFLQADDQLRGLINAGHERETAFHLGCLKVADEFVSGTWTTWTPKILSGIGRLVDTLEDRALIIAMRRRKPTERVERLRCRTRFDYLRRRIVRWVADHETDLREANPNIPAGLHDRAADNWTQLLAIADLVGGDWPWKAREAALELSGVDGTGALGVKVQLLADIRQVFAEAGADRLASERLCELLRGLEGRPWANFGHHERPITPNVLAMLLREFGVGPYTIAVGDKRPKGYHRGQFEDAFGRYLGNSEFESATPQLRLVHGPETNFLQGATYPSVADRKNTVLSSNDGPSCGVAVAKFENGGAREEEAFEPGSWADGTPLPEPPSDLAPVDADGQIMPTDEELL